MLRAITRCRFDEYKRCCYHYPHHYRLIALRSKVFARITIRSVSFNSQARNQPKNVHNTELSFLPLSHLLRNIVISSACSSPTFSKLSYIILKWILDSPTNYRHPHNSERLSPLLKWILKKTLYAHFCAGENYAEIRRTLKELKALQYDGVILEYALEILDTDEHGEHEDRRDGSTEDNDKEAIAKWKRGMLKTVNIVEPENFVGLKWSGLGIRAIQLLKNEKPPTQAMATAIHEVCDAASRKGVTLLPAAESSTTNTGIHEWSLALQQKYNTNKNTKLRHTKTKTEYSENSSNMPSGTVVLHSTYQAYLKSTPQRLLHDLKIASHNGFTLGVKLVRGAYLASEPQRDLLIWDTKEQTDEAYDTITKALLQARIEDLYTLVRHPPSRGRKRTEIEEQKNGTNFSRSEHKRNAFPFPSVSLLLATHNKRSVLEAQRIQAQQVCEREHGGAAGRGGGALVKVAFAQLQGMADEISCELVAEKMKKGKGADAGDTLSVSNNNNDNNENNKNVCIDMHSHSQQPKVYKCLAWGTVEQCLGYLLRRADENMEAAGRTADTARAMVRELWRRIKLRIGIKQ